LGQTGGTGSSINSPRFDTAIGAWVLSRYADVWAALSDPRLVVPGEPPSEAERTARVAVRGAARETFSREHLSEWRTVLEPIARDMASALPRQTTVDLVGEFAAPWALSMAMLAIGAPSTERDRLSGLAREVFVAAAHSTSGDSSAGAAIELSRLIANTRTIDVQSFVALSQTVPAFLAAAWVEAMSRGVRLADVPAAIDELLRLAGPSRVVFREARSEVLIGNACIDAGQRVALSLSLANRDPAKFKDPERLDIMRNAAAHLAFGHGAHSCVGATAVRMAVSVTTEALARVASSMSLVDVQWLEGFAIRAPSSLVVTLRD
jgi:cytochrome P450